MTGKSRQEGTQYREPQVLRGGSSHPAEWIQEGGEKGEKPSNIRRGCCPLSQQAYDGTRRVDTENVSS